MMDTMPKEIAQAIIKIKQTVTMLGADDKNPHGGYKYVSVDKFYEVIGRKMAAEGLALIVDETAAEVREGSKGNPWLFTQYSMAFLHTSGVMSPPMRRSCALPISGPQAFGAAQSYIEKQFLRQIFKIPTGEQDADAIAPEDANGNGTPTLLINTEQRKALMDLADEVGADKAKFLAWLRVGSFAEIPAVHYQKAVAALNSKRQPEAAQ